MCRLPQLDPAKGLQLKSNWDDASSSEITLPSPPPPPTRNQGGKLGWAHLHKNFLYFAVTQWPYSSVEVLSKQQVKRPFHEYAFEKSSRSDICPISL
ncbi:unnamed protein product [Protopolystoma xenopodis]|uniref:Uncharacterized protein n=1 Tax=Protopolystoma xenopodis TaxID=117903 RepID=A0A448WXV9_9PLAT|nr:unnamed protein product [Protopolystoma xenopodis]